MTNSKLPKLILTLGMLFNFTFQIKSEIIPITFGDSPKHLPTSTKSRANGIDDGTLLCWLDSFKGGSLYIQKMDSDGQLQWEGGGVVLDTEVGMSFDPGSNYPMIYSDNLGGALVIYGKDFYSSREIYVAKIYSNGIAAKSPVCITSYTGGYNYSVTSVATKDNSIVACWENFEDEDFNIYAQKLNLDGNVIWNDSKEVAVCIESHDQRKPTITCDENNSTVITWLDDRYSSDYPEYVFDLFANRLSPKGDYTQFNKKGKLIFSYYHHKLKPVMKKPDAGSRKMIFYNHNIISSDKNSSIFAVDQWDGDSNSFIVITKVDENFEMIWTRSVDDNSFQFKPLLTSDNNNGVYVFWNDHRNTENLVYGIGLDINGNITTGTESGVKISCDKIKGTFTRTLPSEKNQNGVYSEGNKVYLSWVTAGNNDLILSTINLLKKYSICDNNTSINNNVSEGESTSITTNNNKVVVVFKQSQNIYAWIKVKFDPVKEDIKNKIIKKIIIDNFPNPFNPITKINYTLPSDGFVKLNVYDLSGRAIGSLVNEMKTSGVYSIEFNGSELSSGVYFYRMELNGLVETGKMTLIK